MDSNNEQREKEIRKVSFDRRNYFEVDVSISSTVVKVKFSGIEKASSLSFVLEAWSIVIIVFSWPVKMITFKGSPFFRTFM